MNKFVHLHMHSAFSLKQGALKIADAVGLAVEYGMPALAITDTNALYGAVSFYKAAKQAGIKPILGTQLSIGRDEDEQTLRDARVNAPPLDTAVFLAKNLDGYRQLVTLVTLAHQKPRQPFITFQELSMNSTNLFTLIGGGESHILKLFSRGHDESAEAWLSAYKQVCPIDSLYVDIQDHGTSEERSGLPALVRAARALQLPLVATNDVHYRDADGADVQRVLAQLEGGTSARLLQGDKYYFTSQEEMERRFAKLPEAIQNTLVIADACNVELPLGQTLLPKYPTVDGESSDVVLRRAAEVGAVQRYGTLSEKVRERLDYELEVICNLGFADYFLVVADFIRFAHKHGISTGPGRGSAAGSLVAYALRITDVDPVLNHLLFERFLNPERVSWPDIDTDFEFERRGEVIHYVTERYGHEHVAQIGTFGTLAARAAIRDAGRVLQTDPKLVDRLAKLVPSHPGVTLESAWDEVSAIGQLVDSNQFAKSVWDVAKQLEGLPRHTSVHAAGVVISPVPLTDLVPVQPGAEGTLVTQYAMEDIEQLGLLKMDFLGLRTLTLIDRCVESIAKRTGKTIDLRRISNADVPTFRMLSKGETLGCFQLESSGVRRVLRDLKPTHLEDIVAVNALYRPGPMENIPTFIAAKHGKKPIEYPHPDLKPILEDTYGVIVYQEQIMQIAVAMAGFSLGQADLLRRAVSKKKRDVLDAERSRFVAGCLAKGYEEQVANDVYDLIVRFADYGFNRSHACAYAVLAYRTSYLRANFLPDFLAALLTMVIGASEKVAEYTRDAKQHGIQVLPPSVSTSDRGYTVESDTAIRTGLLSVRNVGQAAADAILEARRAGRFTSLVDFLRRVNSRVCNRKAVESLLSAGAFSEFLPKHASPEAALQMLNEAYQVAEEHKQFAGLGLLLEDEQTISVNQATSREAQVLFIRYRGGRQTRTVLENIKRILSSYEGDIPVALYDETTRKTRLLEEQWRVQLSPDLITLLEDAVGIGNVKVGKATAGMTTG